MEAEEREKLFELIDKVEDLYFDLCREEKEIKKLRELAERTFKDFKQFMRETRGGRNDKRTALQG